MYKRQDSPTSLPIYVQFSELLIREIATGRLTDGQRLPPERQLAQQHGLTVGTIRKSLKILEEKGLLERKHGSGNYVRTDPEVQSIYSMFRLELADGGGLPSAKYLDIAQVLKPVDLRDFGTSDQGTRIRRLRFLNNTPAAVEEIWLDADCGSVDPLQVSDSLYRYYQQKLGFWISRAEDYVSVGLVPDWSPADFGKISGEMAGFIERLGWAQGIHPVEYSRTWFDTDVTRYVQRLR